MRCGLPRYDPGGGGINVARIAHVLGASVSALFPAGGHAGDKVTDLVADSGVPVQRITVARSTRESFTVDEDSDRASSTDSSSRVRRLPMPSRPSASKN